MKIFTGTVSGMNPARQKGQIATCYSGGCKHGIRKGVDLAGDGVHCSHGVDTSSGPIEARSSLDGFRKLTGGRTFVYIPEWEQIRIKVAGINKLAVILQNRAHRK